ncbi:uncharacterized protein BCR38DRAFT_412520 [Pseudomassariella vexata]|uniref:DUF6536 domain-containing protein n=1 Tax=Pseudomassariella vexata TaxID=1141098 RepID=A0A1Y2DLA4_9PEZI|nr:uncharacterized protein BCR38DRAFT_412520 [Pseudomassariella vexata]ORY59505.1 hypothetical protein BCR38DRAFT_412520 [Pseudomassariella vexata]
MDINRFNLLFSNLSGWKQAANVNSTVLIVMSLTLLACLITSVSQTGGLAKAFMFYEGTCNGGSASRVNVALHLLLNIVSTAILASSNFFMQVLNSPSREEVDEAHRTGSWLGIGVPSVRNAFKVAPFKTWCWIALLLSSIPIHLLFNSTIFQTDTRMADYHMTIASEGFVNGADFYAPASENRKEPILTFDHSASLTPTGFYDWNYYYDSGEDSDGYLTYLWRSDTKYILDQPKNGYGLMINMSDYADATLEINRNITAAAANAARWEKLTATECYNNYQKCNGLTEYRDVVVIVDQPDGWVRDDVWHFANDTNNAIWDPLVPANESNSLWYSAQCAMVASHWHDNPTMCYPLCNEALGQSFSSETGLDPSDINKANWTFNFFSSEQSIWWVNGTHDNEDYVFFSALDVSNLTSGLQPGAADLTVSYCLAEPADRVCHVGLSNTLLLAVMLCVFIKTGTAVLVTVVLGRRNQAPLVTLGDAIASFIRQPDPNTAGMCILSQEETRRAYRSRRAYVLAAPRQWHTVQKRRWSVVPKTVWWTTYTLFLLGISIVTYFFTMTHSPRGFIPLIIVSVFLHWLLSNTIYLFISEGGYYGTSEFTSSFQKDDTLPDNTAVVLGYSIFFEGALFVMMMVSLFLITVPIFLSFQKLPRNMVNVGSNSLAISAACHASTISLAAAQPSISPDMSRSRFEMPPPPYSAYMPLRDDLDDEADGSRGNTTRVSSHGSGAIKMQTLPGRNSQVTPIGRNSSDEQIPGRKDREQRLEKLSQVKLKWGVIKMPPEWYEEFSVEEPVEHISFGAEEDKVELPLSGRWYA